MRVLVTGHRGFIGSVMATMLRGARYEVVGLDCDLYGDCGFGRVADDTSNLAIDLRNVEVTDLLPFDCVVHLAGISNAATCDLDPNLARSVNHEGTLRLAHCCKKAGVVRFLFASTCSLYAAGGDRLSDEQSLVRPATAYAGLKRACEIDLAGLADATFAPVFLRHATAYGMSPRFRTDLLVNDMVGSALTAGRVEVVGAPAAWQPLIHVEDIARAYLAVLAAPDRLVRNEVFNVVRTAENYRMIDVADAVAELVPWVQRGQRADNSVRRAARVCGAKLSVTFPKLTMRWTLSRGIRQLYDAMTIAGLTAGEWRSDRYRRMLPRTAIGQRRSDTASRSPVARACA